MSARNRSLRERRMAPALSEPDFQRPQKIPTVLPHIKSKRPHFYDELILSPDYVHISKTQKTQHSKPSSLIQNLENLTTSRAKSILTSRPARSVYERYAEEDRIVQRHQQKEEQYRRIVKGLERKSLERYRQRHKGDLSLIYDRLMGML